ncbi:FAD-binding and (Fe-S)-binding domain-containing protein [Nocardioides astragali]|uniref:D-lactate dehydrogenase (cytochrome) n=1 Tax=Nocardioides astragali TaxID=1776736 RepID=A0ABW2NEA4_9ACTN|nr:FAD-binding and (Fe-S)-binding domain-containing protein [Nocardioides astragali]
MSVSARLTDLGVEPTSVRSRAIDLAANAADASHYLLTPSAYVVAQDEAAVSRVMWACSQAGLTMTFRSGGTSLSGQAGTAGVLVDVRRAFRRIEVLDEGGRVRVGPGTTVRAVNTALAPYGRKLGPDPASEAACTIGGVVANNSSGMSCGIAANAYNTLESIRLVLPSGTVVDTGAGDADARLAHDEPALHTGLRELRDRVRENPVMRSDIERLFSLKNTMGYGVNSLIDHHAPSEILAHLVVGSEGTLGFVSSATFRTVAAKPYAATTLLVLPELVSATGLLPELVASEAAAIELLDTRSLQVAARDLRAGPALTELELHTQAALLVEYQAESEQELHELVAGASPLLRDAGPTSDPVTRADLWHIRKGLYASVAGARRSGTTALLEDVAVPMGALTDACTRLDDLFVKHGYDVADTVVFGHAKDGNLHFMITEDLGSAEGVARYAGFTEDMVDAVLDLGGTLKAEHGTGRVMAPFVERQYGPALTTVMRDLKRLCDPQSVLNPGVVLTEDPQAHLRNLKTVHTVETEVDRCVECGFCEPVCPSKDLTLTPRQRIVARRAEQALRTTGAHEQADELAADYDYEGLQTCAADGMCQTMCPVGIDTGSLVRRLRSQQQGRMAQAGGRSAARHWAGATAVSSRALTAAHKMPGVAASLSTLGRRVVGDERVPRWTPDLPRGGNARRALVSPAAEVVFVPSCTGTMFGGDGSASDAFRQLCERAGVPITVPEDIASLCCGMPWSSKGLAEGASAMAEKVQSVLDRTAAGRSITVVSDAASCSEGFAKSLDDSPYLVEDAVAFAARVLLPRLSPERVAGRLALHPTCSSTRSGTDEALRALAAAVADEVFVPPSWGCCGFAGDRGLLHPELTASATSAQAAEVRTFDADVHVSCNRTCEIGMTRAVGSTYHHVLILLEQATR